MLLDLAGVKTGDLLLQDLVFATLEGPLGTGETLIAGWTFVPSSVGTWFTSGDGTLGGVANNLKTFVDNVLASEPAIGFMDELDALPNRSNTGNRGRDWWTPVINLFLTEIDRVRKANKKVLLLGATNYYDCVDDALIRPGRLQQRVRLLPRRVRTRLALFCVIIWEPRSVGMISSSWRGAVACQSQRALTPVDLLSVMVPKDERDPADIRAIAIHEAGQPLLHIDSDEGGKHVHLARERKRRTDLDPLSYPCAFD